MSSNERIIIIFFRLLNNKSIGITSMSKEFKVTSRTIQRDLSIIKKWSYSFGFKLYYKDTTKQYHLINQNNLGFEESLAILKILLASRALSTIEMKKIITSIIDLNHESNVSILKKMIQNELTFYSPLQHNKNCLNEINKMVSFISNREVIIIKYKKNDETLINRNVLPVSIFFSEYYFYIICYELDRKRYINLRLDRLVSFVRTGNSHSISHKNRIEEREVREQMIFMQYGKK